MGKETNLQGQLFEMHWFKRTAPNVYVRKLVDYEEKQLSISKLKALCLLHGFDMLIQSSEITQQYAVVRIYRNQKK